MRRKTYPPLLWSQVDMQGVVRGVTADRYTVRLTAAGWGNIRIEVSNGISSITRYRTRIADAKAAARVAIDDWREAEASRSAEPLISEQVIR
jgi:hypothetical protein